LLEQPEEEEYIEGEIIEPRMLEEENE